MEFKKIIIVYKWGLERDIGELMKLIKDTLGEVEIEAMHHKTLTKSIVRNVDLVITLGGDGTFIEAANLASNAYLLGINSNPNSSEGALTSLNINEIEQLKEILKGKSGTIKLQRARVILNGKKVKEYSLNEVYLGARSQFHTSRYIINYRGQKEEQRSSGVIVSTGTSSPAWFKSAGGKEFSFDEEKLSFIVREPYVGKRVFIPKILKGDLIKDEELIIESQRDFGGVLAIGFKSYKFNTGDIAKIRLSKKPLRVLVKVKS